MLRRLRKDFDPIEMLPADQQFTVVMPKEHKELMSCHDLKPFFGKRVRIVAICTSRKNGGKPYIGFVLPESENPIDCTIKPDYLKLSKPQLKKLGLEQ